MIRLDRVRDRLRLFAQISRETGSTEDAMWAVLEEERRWLLEGKRVGRVFCGKAQAVVNEACGLYGVRLVDFLSTSRHRHICEARYAAMRALRDMGYSLPVIGLHVARHHATVLNGLEVAAARPDLIRAAQSIMSAAIQTLGRS